MPSFYLRYAWRSLWRGGQRSLLAIACVALGVLSVLSMQLLADNLLQLFARDPQVQLGGDLALDRAGNPLSDADLAMVADWQQQGVISDSWLSGTDRQVMITRADSGQVIFLQRAIALEPQRAPLVGNLTLREPTGATLDKVLAETGTVALTRDLADRHGIRPGETIRVRVGTTPPVALRVAAIVAQNPEGLGDTIYYSLDTARAATGRAQPLTTIRLRWGSATSIEGLQATGWSPEGWRITTPEEVAESGRLAGTLFSFMLRAAGLMGLMIGGIGVANTMQVVLARRTLEVAILKTQGYRRGHLLALFGVETALLGLIGGLIGTAAGLAIARVLLDIVSRTGAGLFVWRPDPWMVAGGLLVGVATAVIFGVQAILWASGVRPALLLREQVGGRSRRTVAAVGGVTLLLIAAFALLSSVILGSALQGIAAMLLGVLMLGGLALLFWLLLTVGLRLPIPLPALLRVARTNLLRQRLRAVPILIALFAGSFAIALPANVLRSGGQRVASVRGSDEGYNLVAYGSTAEEAVIVAAMREVGATALYTEREVPATITRADGQPINDGSQPVSPLELADGRDAGAIPFARVVAGAWTASPTSALLPMEYQPLLSLGESLRLTGPSGTERTVQVEGFYESLEAEGLAIPPRQLVVSVETARALAGGTLGVTVVATVPTASLRTAEAAVGTAVPGAMTTSLAAMNDLFVSAYANLFRFVAATAGLAFVAGAILVANTVGLAVVERRREMGILKAVGYRSRDVLGLLMAEQVLVALLAALFSLAATGIAIQFINLRQPAARLQLDLPLSGRMVALALAIALLVTVATAWGTARQRPLAILREE